MSGIAKEGQLPGAGTDLTSIAGGLRKASSPRARKLSWQVDGLFSRQPASSRLVVLKTGSRPEGGCG